MTDKKNPERKDNAIVQLRVKRDQYAPEYQGSMQANINVNHAINESAVLTVQVSDRDKVVSASWVHVHRQENMQSAVVLIVVHFKYICTDCGMFWLCTKFVF